MLHSFRKPLISALVTAYNLIVIPNCLVRHRTKLKAIPHALQSNSTEKIQTYSKVVWYSLLLTTKDRNVNENSVHQSPKITFHLIALIRSKFVSNMVASGHIN